MPEFIDIREGSNILNARSFGTLTSNASFNQGQADTNIVTLQECIDYAVNNNIGAISFPQGQFWMPNNTLWMTHPSNHSGSGLSATYATGASIQTCTLQLYARGTLLQWKDNWGGKCLVISGNEMQVHGLVIFSYQPAASCHKAKPAGSIAIAWTGAPGGATHLTMHEVATLGARVGFQTGWNEDALGDRWRLFNCVHTQHYIGVEVKQTQNFLGEMRDCDVFECMQNVRNQQQFAVNIQGGGYRPVGGGGGDGNQAAFAISSTSGLTAGQLTTTVASPSTRLADGAFNVFAMRTVSFGYVPLVWVSYAAGVITLAIRSAWLSSHFGALDVNTVTDLQAELQAATHLLCCEMGTNFVGAVHASEFHSEAPVPWCMLDTEASINYESWIKGVKYNGEPSGTLSAGSAGGNNAAEAIYACATVHPHFNLGHIRTTISDMGLANTYTSHGIMVDLQPNGFNAEADFQGLNNAQLNVRVHGIHIDDGESYAGNTWRGFGRYDRTPFLPRASAAGLTRAFLARNDQAIPHRGFRPDPMYMPSLTPAQFATVNASLAAVALGSYPVINGSTVYKVSKEGETATAMKFVRSTHVGFSYGQDLTTAKIGSTAAWRFKGASCCVYMDPVLIGWMFPGLGIILNFASADNELIVTGVHPMNGGAIGAAGCGYVTVARATQSGAAGQVNHVVNPGDKVTTYNGSTVKQAAYAFTGSAAFA